ncbi:MAG: branched-chain amino acid transporter permease [Enterovirga sp.]|jgi:branched-chain amino acid transport system permease protein|nr:branched-chain amino acid transporter permease [Enterovirga sp.]
MRTGHFKESYGELVALTDSSVTRAWVGLLVVALLLLPLVAGNYGLSLATAAMITVVGAVGLNLLTGMTGLISVGQSGFLAIGAYTNALLLADYKWPLLASLPASGIVAGVLSLLVGVPSLRLKGLYLAITTLAFAFIVNHVILYAEGLTHGPNGVFLPNASLLGIDVSRDRPLYFLVLAVTILVVLAVLNIKRTRIGRAFLAIRDHDIAARVMGVDLVRYKLLAFVISSFLVGIAGALLSLQIRFVNVDVFGLILSIEALAVIILGGLGSTAGAILGAVFLSMLPELIRIAFSTFGSTQSVTYTTYVYEIRGIAYGVVIVVFLRFKPDGLIGLWRDVRRYWTNWPLAY